MQALYHKYLKGLAKMDDIRNTEGVKLLTIDEIIEKMKDRKTLVVAQETGVHPATIRSIVNGVNKNPVYRVVYELSKYFKTND